MPSLHDVDRPQDVPRLIEAGATFDEVNNAGLCPIHTAAAAGKSAVVRALIEAGDQVDRRDHRQNTPLMWACGEGANLATVDVLIANGADPNAGGGVDADWYPLFEAVSADRYETVEYLLKNGADPTVEDDDENNACFYASDGDIIDLLERHGVIDE